MEILEKIKSEFAAFEAKKNELVNQLREEFPKILQPLFEKSKLINSIGWTQYTPYFNDGDECTFSVHEVNQINGESEYDVIWTRKEIGDYHSRIPNPDFNQEEYEIYESFCDILSEIPDETYRDLFGDHAEITIHRDGRIEVEECKHD